MKDGMELVVIAYSKYKVDDGRISQMLSKPLLTIFGGFFEIFYYSNVCEKLLL